MFYLKVTGAILAGGKSTRMKYNKAFAKLGDYSIIETIINRLTKIFDNNIIISNEPELYKHLGLEVYTDIYPGLGPISGIHSALTNSPNEVIFAIACDMPFVPQALIEYMIEVLDDYDTVVAKIDNFYQATSAVYHKSCLPVLANCLENNKLKTSLIFRELNAKVLDELEVARFGNLDDIFFNINDEKALAYAQELSRRFFR